MTAGVMPLLEAENWSDKMCIHRDDACPDMPLLRSELGMNCFMEVLLEDMPPLKSELGSSAEREICTESFLENMPPHPSELRGNVAREVLLEEVEEEDGDVLSEAEEDADAHVEEVGKTLA